MGSFVKKTLTGYKEVPGGYSDPEAEYYIESMKEYREDLEKLRKAEDTALQAQRDADTRVKRAYDSANRQLTQYCQKADAEAGREVNYYKNRSETQEREISSLKSELEATRADLKKQTYLNNNLKRIARERANAMRGIIPKKEHDGYLVLSSRQWTEHYEYTFTDEEYDAMDYNFKKRHQKPYKERRMAEVWKSVLQTPYDASLPLNQIRGLVEDKDLWDGGVLRDIGCPKMNANDINGLYQSFGKNEEGYEYNGLYKWKFVANYKSGFWELEIYTTKSLQVPEYRRPRQMGRKLGKKKHAPVDPIEFEDEFDW